MRLFSGNKRKVIIPADEVREFMSRFPCSGLRNRSYWFEFDHVGDLIDTDVPQHDDGPGAAALADDARKFYLENR